MRRSPSGRLLLCALWLFFSTILLLPRKVPPPVTQSASDTDMEAWIDQFTAVRHGDIGYSGFVSGSSFAPLDVEEERVVLLSEEPLLPSDALRRLVEQGAAAVPHLLAHLDDNRPTRLEIGRAEPKPLGLFFCATPDYNPWLTPPPAEDDRDVLNLMHRSTGQNAPSTHIVTVGDLCFVALGQIINRNFIAVRYQPTGFIIVSSPTHSPALCAAVRKQWRALTPDRHLAALKADFLWPDHQQRRIEACRRIAYYYPEELEALVAPLLAPPPRGLPAKELAPLIADGLIYDASPRLDRRVRDLLATIEDDDRLALACMMRLVGRGYDALIENYCRRRIAAQSEWTEPLQKMLGKLGWTRVHVAAACKDASGLRALLRRGADGGVAARSGETPLHLAAANGSIELVRLLLSAHPPLDAKDGQGLTAVQRAARADHEAIVRLLVERGCAVPDLLVAASASAVEDARPLLANDPHAVEITNIHQRTPLFIAARRGDRAMAELLMQSGASPAAADKDGAQPLHMAVYRGHVPLVRLMLEHAAPVDTVLPNSGYTPLHIAVHEKHAEIVRLLLACKPRLDGQGGDQEETPLHLAVAAGQRDIVAMLLDAGASVNALDKQGGTPLYRAVDQGDCTLVRMLLEHGASIEARGADSEALPLPRAAASGHVEMVRLLLEHGAHVNARTRKGRTALHAVAAGRDDLVWLSQESFVESHPARDSNGEVMLPRREDSAPLVVARLLLQHHALLDARDEDGETPLHLAAYQGQAAFVRFLLGQGADARAKDCTNVEPLHQAIQGGSTAVAEILLDRGADVNACPDYPRHCTPLHEAISRNNAKMVALLLRRGADREAVDDDWRTPLLLAVKQNKVEIARLLLQHGANVRATALHYGRESLHIAAAREDGAAMIALLLDHKADINAPDRYDGQTPLHVAVDEENEALIRVLLERGADWTIKGRGGRSALDLARESDNAAILALFRHCGALH